MSTPNFTKIQPFREETEEAHGRANFVTEFHAYLVKVREIETAKDFASILTALEARALNLWKIRGTKDFEDLLLELEKETLTPQLVAMIMLTGKSLLKVKEDTSKGGKVANGTSPSKTPRTMPLPIG